MIKKISFAIIILIAFSSSSFAVDRIENGVKISSPKPASEPSTIEHKTITIPAKPKLEETKSPAKIVELKKAAPKKAEPAKEEPFKKSQDANVKEEIINLDKIKAVEVKKEDIDKDESPIVKTDSDEAPISEEAKIKNLNETGLPIPRFVSIKSGEVNARSGPGPTYPIKWVYQRKNLPVEITAEFKLWRRIKDFDGDETWINHAMLSGNRNAIFKIQAIAYSDEEQTGATAEFKKGVQVKLVKCTKTKCYVEYGRTSGWVDKASLWGVYADEVFDK
jgi:SH3-like domain-containing protein